MALKRYGSADCNIMQFSKNGFIPPSFITRVMSFMRMNFSGAFRWMSEIFWFVLGMVDNMRKMQSLLSFGNGKLNRISVWIKIRDLRFMHAVYSTKASPGHYTWGKFSCMLWVWRRWILHGIYVMIIFGRGDEWWVMGDETQVSACADDLFYILSHHV